jgi:uncharacterized protein (DUF302 family)
MALYVRGAEWSISVWSDGGVVTFCISQPFSDAVRCVTAALSIRGLSVIADLDVARRVRHTLGITLPSCKILYVWPAATRVEDVAAGAAVYLPLHVVLTSRRSETDINVAAITPDIHELARAAVMRVQSEVLQALEGISMRMSLV